MDLATLKKLRPTEYSDAADGYRSTSDMASAVKDRIESQITVAMRNSLKGEAASAAIKQLGELGKNFHYVQVECGLVSTALEAFSYEVGAAKSKLDAALDGAQAAKLTVNADGSVSYPAGGEKDADGKIPDGGTVSGLTDGTAAAIGRQSANFDPNPNHRLAQDYADQIAHALKEATEADEKWAPKLRALKADDDLTISDGDWADVSSDTKGVTEAGKKYLDSLPQPPKYGSPKDNAEWWKGLDAEQQAAWISMRPDSVGALDGLPATVRDKANRIVFDETRGKMQTELNSIPAPPPNEWTWISAGGYASKVHTDDWMDWYNKYGERYDHLTKSLKGMQAIQTRFDATGIGELPEAYLLGFSAEGHGRAIVANGNPDTADHQAVYVPGTTSNLGKVDGDITRMKDLWRVANTEAHGQPVSTITWLGYDAPQELVKDSPFEHYAYDGAPAFRDFMDGLDASHSGDSDPHRTVIAHSYGTTLVGAAAQTGHLNADDVVLAGSPGVKVSHAEEMDVPKGHVWNEEADGDPAPDIGRFGHGGDGWVIPSDPSFGANQMTTDTEGHSGYWDVGSDSLRNQARVTVGKFDDVQLKPPPDPWAHVK
ncbi:Alpha/beta hydrolase [Streptomyces sp. yr375]|uniref:alpha/beta hydrolase n=1 Tax=Streptomyces sp. yr375 TaxID=1761906 RepID=UPI0008AA85EF|nr:alpha/beta hydrolase [Streptomyces sp. yr375]SES08181.1 Alpha/beta hydrolase [Streptomyces sp. yr375]